MKTIKALIWELRRTTLVEKLIALWFAWMAYLWISTIVRGFM